MRDRLLRATREVLDEVGEAHLTLAKVVRRAGLTTGAVYSNFENREELIVAVVVEDFAGQLLDDVERLRAVLLGDLTGARYEDALFSIVPRPGGVDSTRIRWLRIRALAAAQRYESVRDALTELQRSVNARLLDTIDEAQRRGTIVADADPRALCQLLQSFGIALVFSELAGDLGTEPDPWVELVTRTIRPLFPIPADQRRRTRPR